MRRMEWTAALLLAAACGPALAQRPRVPASSAPPRNLALIGVTRVGDLARAWLVDLDTSRRETAGPGGLAFGYRVKQVGDDRVVLTRSGREFVLKLGDREVPVREASIPMEIPVVEPDRSAPPPVLPPEQELRPTAPPPAAPVLESSTAPPASAAPPAPGVQAPVYAYVPGYGYVPVSGPYDPGFGSGPYYPAGPAIAPESGPTTPVVRMQRYYSPLRFNPQTGRRNSGSFFGSGVPANPQTLRRRSGR